MKRSATEVSSSESAVKKTKTDDEVHPTVLLLDDSAPHLGNLLRKTMSTHVCQIVVTCSPREQLNLGAAKPYYKSKLQCSPNLRRVAWKNSNCAIDRIEILDFESGKVSNILLTYFLDNDGSDMEDDDDDIHLGSFCLSDDALFVWIEASSLGDDVIRMVRMDLESQSIDWMEDGDLKMLGYYAPLDQIITCRDEKYFMVRVNAKTGEQIGQPFDMTPHYDVNPKFLINVHQDMVLLWQDRQLIFPKQNPMAYQVLDNELHLNENFLYIDKDLAITSDRSCYDNDTGIYIGTVDCLSTGLPKYTKYCWLSSRGDTIILWESDQLFKCKFHVEKKMIECPLGSAARSEVLRLNGKLPKTFILNEFNQPLNAYVHAIEWNDKQWMVLNDERMCILDPFIIIISQHKDGRISMVYDKSIYLRDAMIHVKRHHAKFEIPFLEFLSKLQRVEPQEFRFKDDLISAFVDYPKIVNLLGDDLTSAEIDQCYKKLVKSQQEKRQKRKKKVLKLVIKLQDQTVQVNGTDYSRADLVVAYEGKIGRDDDGCITFIH